jgi:hypothetical protein
MSICSDCTKNSHLKERIEDEGKHAFCSICRLDKAKVFSVDDLALVISNAMQEHFESNPQTYFLTHEDHELTQTHGDPLEMVVSEMLEQNVEFFDALLDAIAETSEFDVETGSLTSSRLEPYLLQSAGTMKEIISVLTGRNSLLS